MKYFTSVLFLIYSFNIHSQNINNMDNIENTHFLEIMENISLEVMSERFIGALVFKSPTEFEAECLKRVNSKYTQEEIIQLKQNIPPDFKAPFKNNIEILKELIAFNEKIFIPSTFDFRQKIKDQITAQEKMKIEDIRSDYLTDLDIYINTEKDKILNNKDLTEIQKENKLEEFNLTSKLYKIKPMLSFVEKKENENSKYLSILAEKYISILDNYEQQITDLKKQWFKIRIGRLGNFLGAVMSFEDDKNKLRTSYLLESLLIE